MSPLSAAAAPRRAPSAEGRERRAGCRGPLALLWLLLAAFAPLRGQDVPARLDRGRITAVFFPRDRTLAEHLLARAAADDSFPGLPRPAGRVLLALAPDARRFREWAGAGAPEWGAALAFPESHRIVMQGSAAGSDAGDPLAVLRHELAHLALHEHLGDLPPRWFDEGYASYAAGEWRREDALATNVALLLRGMPTLDELEAQFGSATTGVEAAYALSYRAVAELAALDPPRGLALLFTYWKETGSLDQAVRRAYGITLAAFEERWRARTRQRYGALALVGDLAVLGFVLMLLLAPLWLARRRRDRQRMAALVAADQVAEREARESLLAELLGEAPSPADLPPAPPPGPPPEVT